MGRWMAVQEDMEAGVVVEILVLVVLVVVAVVLEY